MEVMTDRRLIDGNKLSSGPPGTEDSFEPGKNSTSSSKESTSRSKRRDSRSKSPNHQRRRSKSRSYSPSDRRRQRDPRRQRGRRSRSRGPRSPPRARKSDSRERYRSNRRNWSPHKKGPVSPPPPPIPIQQQQVNHTVNPFAMPPPQIYSDGYNNYPTSYAPPTQGYTAYDYGMQTQPQFNAYPNQAVMQPIPPGDDFQSGWAQPTHMVIPPPGLVIPPPLQAPIETEEEKQKREAAVAKEKKTQRATLGKQREDYKRRATALKRELNTLKEQRDDLVSGSEPPSPTTKGFIKENDRLQGVKESPKLVPKKEKIQLNGSISFDVIKREKQNWYEDPSIQSMLFAQLNGGVKMENYRSKPSSLWQPAGPSEAEQPGPSTWQQPRPFTSQEPGPSTSQQSVLPLTDFDDERPNMFARRSKKKRKSKHDDNDEEEPDDESEIGISETYADYTPIKLKYGCQHPYPVVESASLSSVLPPNIFYKLSIPEKTINEGQLSALQLESIIYASQAHSKLLSDGSRAGFFIGDGAGVGKGRTIAGIILENYMHNRRKALWVSYSTDLQVDAERDLADVGAGHIKTHLLNHFQYKKILEKEGILFSTYQSLIGSSKSKKNRFSTHLKQIIDFLGEDFDGCIVFDECHKAKNLVAESSKKTTKTGKVVLELQNALPNARIVYSSATGASMPRNMAYMIRLGIWGPDTPFKTFADFITVVEKRGVGTMEIIAMDMKLRGMYIARQLSFRGVSFYIEEVPFTNSEAYDRAVDLWVEAKQCFETAIDLLRIEPRFIWMQFWRTHQRFFQYFCISAKVEHLARLALDAVKNGKCVVIGLQLTGEGPTNQHLRQNSNITDFISAAHLCFQSLVENQFPTISERQTAGKRPKSKSNRRAKRQRLTESSDELDSESDLDDAGSMDGTDSDDSFDSEDDVPLASRIELAKAENDNEAIEELLLQMKKSLLRKITNLSPDLPPNTLDYLIDCLGGTETVAEMTGRKGRVVRNASGRIIYESRKEHDISLESINLIERERFMNGDKLIAIISEAASSGISLHSDRRVLNQRQRVHFTLELPWSADKAVQQFGRTHRSNQVNSPECVVLISNLAGERRFASVIAKRLETLGALLHGDRRASESRDLSQFHIDNHYGIDALEKVLKSIVNETKMTNVPSIPEDYVGNFYKDIQNALIGVGLINEHVVKTPILSIEQTNQGQSMQEEIKTLELSNGYKKIPRFLNRILGIKVELQNRLFKFFTDTLTASINYAKKMGTYDKGILDLGSADEVVTRINTIRYFRPLDSGTAVIDLQKFHIVRGMDWQKVMDIYPELNDQREGFYLSVDSGGSKRTAILIALNVARGGDGIRVYRPHISATSEYFNDLKHKYVKVEPQYARRHWDYQYDSSLTTCRHAFMNGNCKQVTFGRQCEYGLRARTYGLLSGAVLSTWSTVEKVLVGLTNRKIQVIRIRVNDEDKVFGTLVPNDRFDQLKGALEKDSATVEHINFTK